MIDPESTYCRGNITVRLVSSLTGVDSASLLHT